MGPGDVCVRVGYLEFRFGRRARLSLKHRRDAASFLSVVVFSRWAARIYAYYNVVFPARVLNTFIVHTNYDGPHFYYFVTSDGRFLIGAYYYYYCYCRYFRSYSQTYYE